MPKVLDLEYDRESVGRARISLEQGPFQVTAIGDGLAGLARSYTPPHSFKLFGEPEC